jgi:hypothetical protein
MVNDSLVLDRGWEIRGGLALSASIKLFMIVIIEQL